MSEVASIIDRLGGYAKVADAIGKPPGTVAAWRHRGSIPVKHWPRLGEMATAINIPDITYSHLVAAHASSEAPLASADQPERAA